MEPDYYEILQVSAEAEDEVIGAAYKRLARKYHPDLNPDLTAIRRMRELNRAIEVLGDPQKRREYDTRRRRSGTNKGKQGLLTGSHAPAVKPRSGLSRVMLFSFFFVGGAVLGLALILILFVLDTGGGAPAPAVPPDGEGSAPTANPAAAGASSAPASPEITPPPPGSGTFSNGTWLVGEEIAPGIWRAVRSRACTWKRLSSIEGPVENVVGSGSYLTVELKPSDAAFSSDGCGWWSQILTPPSASPTEPFGPGTWLVVEEIAPGLWQNSDSSEGCSWARLSRLDGEPSATTAHGSGFSVLVVEITKADYAFDSWGCGTWTRLG
jgi:hypothetical protein